MKTKFLFPALCVLMMCLVACEQNEPNIPETIVGAFSVSATKQVRFAPGNLQYQASTNTWRFAEHQYDVSGYDNRNFTDLYSGWLDLFGWGTGNNPTNISTDNSDFSTFVDWGTNKIGSYAENTWRTLSRDEWNYIFVERQNASSLYGSATVAGQTGVIVIPDSTSVPVSFIAGMNGYSQNTYSAAEWAAIEKEVGALFLPASGNREGSYVHVVGKSGLYMSSTSLDDDRYVYSVIFTDSYLNPQEYLSRCRGLAVRLAKDL